MNKKEKQETNKNAWLKEKQNWSSSEQMSACYWGDCFNFLSTPNIQFFLCPYVGAHFNSVLWPLFSLWFWCGSCLLLVARLAFLHCRDVDAVFLSLLHPLCHRYQPQDKPFDSSPSLVTCFFFDSSNVCLAKSLFLLILSARCLSVFPSSLELFFAWFFVLNPVVLPLRIVSWLCIV